MTSLIKPPQRYTIDEWKLASKLKHKQSEIDRARTERLIAESGRLDGETREQSDVTLSDVNKKLEQRIADITYWKSELERKLDDLYKETDALDVYRRRVEKAIESIQEPLHIAQTVLANREKRQEIDLVHDNVQKELINEVDCEAGVLTLLKKLHEQINEQLRLNRKAKYNLECDLKDKFTAQNIDKYVNNLGLTSPETYLKNGSAKIEPNSFDEVQYENFSDHNTKNAEATRLNSSQLRNMIDSHLQQVANDMHNQIKLTNRAFERRIKEQVEAKSKLESQLKDVVKLIDDLEENIKNLEKAIADKENYIKLAHTRLDVRTQRPNIELVRDPAQYKLVQEVNELESAVRVLQARLADSRKKLKDLDRDRLILEKDIRIKSNSIQIDEAENYNGLRKSLLINQF